MDQPDPKHPSPNPCTKLDQREAPQLETYPDLLFYLWRQGHFNPRDNNNFATHQVPWEQIQPLPADAPQVRLAIYSWQDMRPGLPLTGRFSLDFQEAALRETQLRCGLPDIIPIQALGAAWPAECKHDITTCHQLAPLTYPDDVGQTKDNAWDKGLQMWNDLGDLHITRVGPCPSSRVRATVERMGNYILAWSELANGDCAARLQQAYNLDIRWTWHLLWTTICHEIGHALGIAHGGTGIMKPVHDPNITQLDAWDREQLIQRYGPRPEPPPPPSPEPCAFHHACILLYDKNDRQIASYEFKPTPTC